MSRGGCALLAVATLAVFFLVLCWANWVAPVGAP